MLLKAAINGKRTLEEHPAVPLTPREQPHQAALAVAAGAGAIHVHPRDAHGRESLAPDEVAVSLEAIRTACQSTAIGVSTGAWIVPDADRRLALIGAWEGLPDFAAANGAQANSQSGAFLRSRSSRFGSRIVEPWSVIAI